MTTIRHISLVMMIALSVTLSAQQPPPPPAPPAGSAEAGQQPPITFKVEINYVEVDAIVTDAQGNFVRELRREDFQVLEEGKPQQIAIFMPVNIPVERAEQPLFATTPIPPDVQTNDRQGDGRLYLIVLDDLHTLFARTPRVKAAARQFIERHLGANDLAAIISTGGRTDVGQEFTSNKLLLLAAVDKFSGRKVRSSTLERLDEYQRTRDSRQQGDRIDDPSDFERGFQARNFLDTLQSAAEFLAGVRGRRKTLLLFSEGIDYDIYDVFGARDASTILNETRDTIAAATRANVNIYAVDPRGLTNLSDESIEIGSLPEDTSLNLGTSSLQSELRLSQDSLRVLADETGGFAAVNANDFNSAFDRIVRENSSYYVLGYYPADERRDGKFRKIEVKVTRPGLTVRARKGYVAPRGRETPRAAQGAAGTSIELRNAIENPVPIPGLTLRSFVAPFKAAAPNASVLIALEMDGRDLKFTQKDELFLDDVELSLMAMDQQGKMRAGDRQSINLKLKPETHRAVAQNGFRLLSRVEVPPGRYQFRFAARESGAGTIGSVHHDLIVPDYSKEPFAMSGLVIASASSALTPTARPDEMLKAVLPAPPTSRREFPLNDELALFVEVYDNEAAKPHKVDIVTTVRTDDGRQVFETTDARDSSELQGQRGGFGHTARIPMKGFSPGLYVLRVEAKSRLGNREAVIREVQFRIVPGGASGGNPPSPAIAGNGTGTAPGAEREASATQNTVRGSVTFEPLKSGTMSGIEQGQEMVIRSQADWEKLWKSHAPDSSPPAVDFTQYAVVAVFLGTRPSAGHSVAITSLTSAGSDLVVQYRETKPAPGMMTAQVLTSPFQLARIPRPDGEVRFEKVK